MCVCMWHACVCTYKLCKSQQSRLIGAQVANAQVVDTSHTSVLLNVGITIVENSLSEHLEDHLHAMPGHTSFSTGSSVQTPSTATESEAASTVFTPATLIDDFKLSKEKKKRRPVCSCTVPVILRMCACVHVCMYMHHGAIVAKSPDFAGTVPIFRPLSRLHVVSCHAFDGPPGFSTARSCAVSGPPRPKAIATFGPPLALYLRCTVTPSPFSARMDYRP